MSATPYWCPLCKEQKEGDYFVVGMRDGMNAHRICPSHVPEEHHPANNPNHCDGTLRDFVYENDSLVALPKPEPQPATRRSRKE